MESFQRIDKDHYFGFACQKRFSQDSFSKAVLTHAEVGKLVPVGNDFFSWGGRWPTWEPFFLDKSAFGDTFLAR